MAFRRIAKTTVVMATNQLAKEHVQLPCLRNDRHLDGKRLEYLRKQHEKGWLRCVSWATCKCLSDGVTYRVNGNHTSNLVILLAGNVKIEVVREQYEADTLLDVSDLWMTYDAKESGRNSREIVLSHASAFPEFADLPNHVLICATSGISYWTYRDQAGRISIKDRVGLLDAHPKFVLWLNAIAGSTNEHRNLLMKRPVVAAMFGTWFACAGYDHRSEDVNVFWRAVRDQTGTDPDFPDRKLAMWLATHATNTNNSSSKKHTASDREFYVRCIRAWNAYCKGTNTELRYSPHDPLPDIVCPVPGSKDLKEMPPAEAPDVSPEIKAKAAELLANRLNARAKQRPQQPQSRPEPANRLP